MRLLLASLVCLFLSSCGKAPIVTPTEMYKFAAPSVVRIEIPNKGTGTGFYTTDLLGRKVIVTNAHVCLERRQPLIIHPSKVGRPFRVVPKYISYITDLCVIAAPEGDTHPALTIATKALADGEPLFIAGHPRGNPFTVSKGTVVGPMKVEVAYPETFCENGSGKLVNGFFGPICAKEMRSFGMEVVMKPGNSGGPILSQYGEVVGVAFAGGDGGQFALRLSELRRVLSLLK